MLTAGQHLNIKSKDEKLDQILRVISCQGGGTLLNWLSRIFAKTRLSKDECGKQKSKAKSRRSLIKVWSRSVFVPLQNPSLPFFWFEAFLFSEFSPCYNNLNKIISLIFPFVLSLTITFYLFELPWSREEFLNLGS